ncbi:MAG: YjaG family protein [Marinobacter sp.]|nr:YjaG family protein [Marinobacter sp.]
MNANQFVKALEQLRSWREYAFLLSLAERSLPNYALFSDAIGMKGGAKVRMLLDEAWSLLESRGSDAAIPQMLAKLEGLTPNVDRYDVYGVYPAYDFCQLLEQALLNRLNPTKQRALEGSRLATDTVMKFLEVSEGAELDEDELVRLLDHHELMKADKAFQREVLIAVRKQRYPTEGFIRELREAAANDGVSNLGIGLDE